MAVITEDQIGGSSGSQTLTGIKATRVFIVSELDAEAASFIGAALDLGPALYDFHPTIPNIQATNKTATAIDAKKVRLTVQYDSIDAGDSPTAPPDATTVSVGSSVQQVQTNKDVTGQPISIQGVLDGNVLEAQGALVDIFEPQLTVNFQRRTETNPKDEAQVYVGRVNSSGFYGFPTNSVLCTGITGQSNDGGITFETTYEFQYNRRTWVPDVVYTDSETGLPIDGATIANGLVQAVNVYDGADFNALGLF